MKGSSDPAARQLGRRGLRADHPHDTETRTGTRTILIAGVVHFVDRLQGLAGIERARLRGVLSHAVRDGPDAIVVGTASPATGALEVIGELKRHERASRIPLLHLVPSGASCGVCGAEICLAAEVGASTLVSAVSLLLRLREAERHRDDERTDARLIALGRLAGGVVHDFNNLLLVMTGHVELARRLLGEGHPGAARLVPVLHAAERAAALTRQLLALGRASPGAARLRGRRRRAGPARARCCGACSAPTFGSRSARAEAWGRCGRIRRRWSSSFSTSSSTPATRCPKAAA